MKLIKPSVEFFGAVPTDYNEVIRFIELAGRTCYKSEDKITESSAEKFVRKLIKAGHLAMVEHSNFVIMLECLSSTEYFDTIDEIYGINNKYLQMYYVPEQLIIYLGGNLTAWYQALKLDFIFYPFIETYGDLFNLLKPGVHDSRWKACPHNEIPPALHRYAAKFICDRGVSHELVRHRPCSFAQESTRYVNYAGKDMEFIEPAGFDYWKPTQKHYFLDACRYAEIAYLDLSDTGLKPQQSRAVLPNALKTEIVVTADSAEWSHIRKLRTDKAAHPDMQRVMNMMPWNDFL